MTAAIPEGLRPTDELPTSPQAALRHACRLLRAAEMTDDRQLMERLEQLADSWIHVSHVLLALRETA